MVLLWKLFAANLLVPAFVQAGSLPAATPDVVFKKDTIVLNGKTISVELAETDDQHERGLMFRKSMPENEGMLFIFTGEATRSFWMKNTYIDLSIGYFDKDKNLIDIQEMKATSVMEPRPPSYPSVKPAMYALEMNKAWFAKNKVKIGHKFHYKSRRQ